MITRTERVKDILNGDMFELTNREPYPRLNLFRSEQCYSRPVDVGRLEAIWTVFVRYSFPKG